MGHTCVHVSAVSTSFWSNVPRVSTSWQHRCPSRLHVPAALCPSLTDSVIVSSSPQPQCPGRAAVLSVFVSLPRQCPVRVNVEVMRLCCLRFNVPSALMSRLRRCPTCIDFWAVPLSYLCWCPSSLGIPAALLYRLRRCLHQVDTWAAPLCFLCRCLGCVDVLSVSVSWLCLCPPESMSWLIDTPTASMFCFLNIFIDYAISCPICLPPLHSILPTPSLPHSPPIVHVHGSYL